MKKLLLAAATMLALSAPALAETIVATAKVDNVVVAVQSSDLWIRSML